MSSQGLSPRSARSHAEERVVSPTLGVLHVHPVAATGIHRGDLEPTFPIRPREQPTIEVVVAARADPPARNGNTDPVDEHAANRRGRAQHDLDVTASPGILVREHDKLSNAIAA